MKQLPLSRLNELFAAIAAEQQLYLPADDASGQANYTRWQEGVSLTKHLNTVRSAKDLFFPQVENLVDFRVEGKNLELIEHSAEIAPFVLFGVRACDCRSFDILDRVFLSSATDTFYQARREHVTVVTLACSRPEWKQLSESCLGCGTCTFVCPTCQCYAIEEFDTGKKVRRFRCWDSCMYSDFTQMSAGQPRPTQLERFRQRPC